MAVVKASRSSAGQQVVVGRGLFTSRVAGVLYATIIVCGIFAEVAVRSELIVFDDAAATAANVLRSATLFRVGVLADIVMLLCDVAIAVVLYHLLKSVHRGLSMMAAAFRMTQAAVLGFNLLNMFRALRILDDARYLAAASGTASGDPAVGVFGRSQLESLALLSLDDHRFGYIFGLTFFGVSTIITGRMACLSPVMPTAMGTLLMLAGAGYLVDAIMFVLIPAYDGWASGFVLGPAFIGEVWFAGWLLLKGVAIDRAGVVSSD